jgi:hypothetical protein
MLGDGSGDVEFDHDTAPDPGFIAGPLAKHVEQELFGFRRTTHTGRLADVPMADGSTRSGGYGTRRSLAVPYWAVFFVASVTLVKLPLRFRLIQDMYRIRRGRCVGCGYDLRATPARCPECGHTPDVKV